MAKTQATTQDRLYFTSTGPDCEKCYAVRASMLLAPSLKLPCQQQWLRFLPQNSRVVKLNSYRGEGALKTLDKYLPIEG